MLFLQGSRDKLAELGLLSRLIERLGERASLQLIQDADHSFRVPARAGRNDADVKRDMMDALAAWIGSGVSPGGPTPPLSPGGREGGGPPPPAPPAPRLPAARRA